MKEILNKITKFSIYLLVFLVPLWFLPFSFEKFEFNKQYLLFFLTSITFFTWLAKQILYEKELRFRRTPLDLPVLIFLGIAILSAIFSVDRYSSLFGFYGRFSDGLINLLSLGVLYFLITNNIGLSEKVKVKKPVSSRGRGLGEETPDVTPKLNRHPNLLTLNGLLKTLMWSSFFVVLISYLSIFNQFPNLNFQFFNPVAASLEGLAVFLAVIVVLLVVLSQSNCLVLAAAMGLLLVIDFAGAWWVLIATLSLFLIFVLRTRIYQEDVRRFFLPIALIVIAGLGLAFDFLPHQKFGGGFNQLFNFQLPKEQILDQGTSWQIAFKTLIDNGKNFFLGSGIGTFFNDFVKEKPKEFNQTLFWQVRYDRGGNHISEIIATTGVFGFLSYLFLVGVFLMVSYILIVSSKQQAFSQLPLLVAFIALLVGQFVYYQNTVLSFMFWFFLGISAVSWKRAIKEKTLSFSLKIFPEMELLFEAILVILVLAIFLSGYWGVKIYQADIAYAKAEMNDIQQERTKLLEEAVKKNPNFAHYKIILARSYLTEVLDELKKPQNLQNSQFLQERIAKAIDVAKKATEMSPNNVVTWETLGTIYRDIRTVATGALGWAQKAFSRAVLLEPANPILHTELGKLYLISGETEKAKLEFEKALELKSDYVDASLQIALVLEKEEKIEEAIRKLEDLADLYPVNTEILFQLGRLYYNNNQISDAILVLERVVKINPNHSNALYSLGVAYKKNGETQKAIEVFERVLELNPGNQDVKQKIEELRK
ncbi:tetratricopeptide repeat protein [bacterium]|nr:tetratricopeptide repeat protein [bacterium]